MAAFLLAGLAAAFFVCRNGSLGRNVMHACATTDQTFQTGPLTGAANAVQQFRADYGHLTSLELIFRKPDNASGTVRVAVYDENGTMYAETYRELASLRSDVYESFALNAELIPGNLYYFMVEAFGEGENAPALVYRPLILDRIDENQVFYYDGAAIGGASGACRYLYRLPLTKLQIGCYTAFCLFAALCFGSFVCLGIDWVKALLHKKSEVLLRSGSNE